MSERSDIEPWRAKTIEVVLRVGAGLCFIGHGAFGILAKPGWLRYLSLFGIGPERGFRVMPVIGMVDITIGFALLFAPVLPVIVWAVVWTVFTALLRPAAGEGWWEFLERAGNYGVPLALGLSAAPISGWWARLTQRVHVDPGPGAMYRGALVLRVSTAALLIGHGGYGAVMHKASWVNYLAKLGIRPSSMEQIPSIVHLVSSIGWVEIALGVVVLLRPNAALLGVVVVWKVFTERLRIKAGEPSWEFVERFGSYSAPLALLIIPASYRLWLPTLTASAEIVEVHLGLRSVEAVPLRNVKNRFARHVHAVHGR